MKYVELTLTFVILTSVALLTIASLKTLNSMDMKNDVVKPIIERNVR